LANSHAPHLYSPKCLEGMLCERRHVFLGSSQLAPVDGIMLIG
jgi:hypothetical protein